ncbi:MULTISPECIES: hypothetical protein [unclassified Shinella]|uniref:hypothetical protein n=1 Tax=unclassified Shinella TaxID=2643062 RepID=UPI00225D645E|nr:MULTISPECIES: hypothetical protein [unclassified Shinella]MCO5139276.1 hypothetical protein [Shinella sp.]MDC7255995.1 hypothetical protein [Shinella sp. YE25]CAI0338832.1 conserved hypothetical protein [Rhizobiaceae bacterium]CAK7257261.1 Twin-arginine translocation pathway signal protein [Shinella sp. WSC3-e]
MMPNNVVQAAAEGMPILTRRKALGLMAAISVPPAAVVAAAATEPKTPSIDEFLAKALPSEKVRYHSNALLDAMAEMHPDQAGWRVQIDHEYTFAIVTSRRKVGKVYAVVDDGSPLLADDVTGTTAFANWERDRV